MNNEEIINKMAELIDAIRETPPHKRVEEENEFILRVNGEEFLVKSYVFSLDAQISVGSLKGSAELEMILCNTEESERLVTEWFKNPNARVEFQCEDYNFNQPARCNAEIYEYVVSKEYIKIIFTPSN